MVDIKRDVILGPLTSFGIGGPAQFYAEPATPEELSECLDFAKANGLPVSVLSFGTDVLIADEGVPGLLISMRRMKGISIDRGLLIAGSGEGLARVCLFSAELGLSGTEELYGIPGAIGGAVAKNAGAYGREMAEVVEWAEVMGYNGKVIQITKEELGMGYRTSRLPEIGILVRVALKLERGDPTKLRSTMYYYNEKRKRHQPIGQRSAGCVFKNPPGAHAAVLIEAAGLKGKRVGDAMVSPVHANFIVNVDQATARNVMELIEMIKARVRELHGVELETEIEFMPGGKI
ncbi:MAG: UDP-N-acetylmuramate dehydrogenase [candidate division WOR-3 bacterium]